jgi:hypothetical protein
MEFFEGGDWIRRVLFMFLVASLIFVVHHSFTLLFANKVAFTQTVQSRSALLYPSVTMCPYPLGYDRVDDNIPLSKQFEELPHLEELVISVNHSYQENGRLVLTLLKRISCSGYTVHGPLKLRTVHFGDSTIIYENKVSS